MLKNGARKMAKLSLKILCYLQSKILKVHFSTLCMKELEVCEVLLDLEVEGRNYLFIFYYYLG